MNDMDEYRGSCRIELKASTAVVPVQEATESLSASDGDGGDDGMDTFNFDHVCILEMAHTDLVCEGLRIDPDDLDLSPCMRFWSHLCMEHGDLIAEAFAREIPARTIVLGLQEAQDESDASPCMDEIATCSTELAKQLRAAVTHPEMTWMWNPRDILARAAEFRVGDAAAEIAEWDMESVQELFDMLMDMVDLCEATGEALADYVDIDDLPSAPLPVGCTGEKVWAHDRQGQVIAGTALTRAEAQVMPLKACDWALLGAN